MDEYNSFYDVGRTDSFGYVLARINEGNKETYNCPDDDEHPDNCTATYLAQYQWGSSYVTLNPQINTGENTYNGKTYSISDWGQYKIPGVEQSPEYFNWAQKQNVGDPVALNVN